MGNRREENVVNVRVGNAVVRVQDNVCVMIHATSGRVLIKMGQNGNMMFGY
jgi:hypothetical protein